MPTLAEIIAAKKAAAASSKEPDKPVEKPTEKPEDKPVAIASPVDLGFGDIVSAEIPPIVAKTLEANIAKEVAVTQAKKPMSFAEKMAEKKRLENPTAVTTVKDSAPVVSLPSSPALISNTVDTLEEEGDKDQQAYSDIKRRIEQLESLSETALGNAMTELKLALLANPNAVSLMEYSDFGKMVVALRSYVKEGMIEVTAAKKGKKAAKIDLLDPDAMALAFEEI